MAKISAVSSSGAGLPQAIKNFVATDQYGTPRTVQAVSVHSRDALFPNYPADRTAKSSNVVNISSAVANGDYLTVTTSTNHGLVTGDAIVIAGSTTTQNNGEWQVTSLDLVSPNTIFTVYAKTTPSVATQAASGTVTRLVPHIVAKPGYTYCRVANSCTTITDGVSVNYSNPASLDSATLNGLTGTFTSVSAGAPELTDLDQDNFDIACAYQPSGGNTITAATVASGSTTFTTTSAHGLVIGQKIRVRGASVTAFNIDDYITSVPTTSSFTVAQAPAGTYSGTAYIIASPIIMKLNNNLTTNDLPEFPTTGGTFSISASGTSITCNATGVTSTLLPVGTIVDISIPSGVTLPAGNYGTWTVGTVTGQFATLTHTLTPAGGYQLPVGTRLTATNGTGSLGTGCYIVAVNSATQYIVASTSGLIAGAVTNVIANGAGSSLNLRGAKVATVSLGSFTITHSALGTPVSTAGAKVKVTKALTSVHNGELSVSSWHEEWPQTVLIKSASGSAVAGHTSTQVRIDWVARNATSYKVYRTSSSTLQIYGVVQSQSLNTTTRVLLYSGTAGYFNYEDATPSTDYTFIVEGTGPIDTIGTIGTSSFVFSYTTPVLPAPTIVSLTQGAYNTSNGTYPITIVWTAVADATGYDIINTATDTNIVSNTAGTAVTAGLSYTMTGFTPNTSYTFAVKSIRTV